MQPRAPLLREHGLVQRVRHLTGHVRKPAAELAAKVLRETLAELFETLLLPPNLKLPVLTVFSIAPYNMYPNFRNIRLEIYVDSK